MTARIDNNFERRSAAANLTPYPAPVASPSTFRSILFPDPSFVDIAASEPACFHDLNLNQVVAAITLNWPDYHLAPFFHTPLRDLDAITYRQDVMRELQHDAALQAVTSFSQQMRAVRRYLQHSKDSHYKYERERWLLDAAVVYCDAVQRLSDRLRAQNLVSRGLQDLAQYFGAYLSSEIFQALLNDTRKLHGELSQVRYCLLIGDGKFTVRRCEDEADYSVIVESTFSKFRQGAVRTYLADLPCSTGMNHIQAAVIERVARLFPAVFESLQEFAANHADFVDEVIQRFDRDVHFYIAYIEHIATFQKTGLHFSYPVLSTTSKQESVEDAFDLALAHKSAERKQSVVTNSFFLKGSERIVIVSGPNQGGKTTFARAFGQLHYLASLGCPIPGTKAKLFLQDQIFTHFEKEEDIRNLRGKLHDDLVRIRQILQQATPNSIIIMNELFSSTTLHDASNLSRKILERVSQLDLLSVWVTFLTELATFNEKTVSMVSGVDPVDPAIRTFKIERRPAEGIAYALVLAKKHRVTYQDLKERMKA